MVLTKKEMEMLLELIRTERDMATGDAEDCEQAGDSRSAEGCRRNAERHALLLDKIQRVTPIGQSVTLDDLIFYSVRYYGSRNRRQHIEAVDGWQFLMGDERVTTYAINNRILALVIAGELIEEKKNQYAGWRYRLDASNPRSEGAEQAKQLIQAWTEYRAWHKK